MAKIGKPDLQRITDFAEPIIKRYNAENQPLAFWVFDIKSVEDAINRWAKVLPSVHPMYAVKCNPEPHLVELLGNLGCGFDCATLNEVKEVLKLGFRVEDITFSQVFKPYRDLIMAYALGVRLTIVDSVNEVQKIAKYAPDMGIMVRIMKNDTTANYSLGDRFGLRDEAEYEDVIKEIARLKLNMKGVHFHVGSDSQNCQIFKEALQVAKFLVDISHKYGLHPDLFDLGGGFSQTAPFEDFGEVIENSIKELGFPEGSRFIAEPGRYLASNAFHLVTSIHGKRVRNIDGKREIDYTVGDGIHGCLAHCLLFNREDECYCPTKRSEGAVLYKSYIFGPSCDGRDLTSSGLFPELQEGVDWIIFPCTGAYSISLATNFNGFESKEHDVHIMKSEDVDKIKVPPYIEKHSVHALRSKVPKWFQE
ncbi:ornithine decarboxylase, putative [Entamoeba invadens IP1]|uniref:ornithine decarboxylase n=1 Tax=Entamoeba invadens IP1 TaxID=370355 RepID=A0A0A1UFM1_ENTIV|nr:ornithine decarboxylase, putative [Entamoeba invadens IP1]ELP92759.1 ornithine decarboxylase, putative [Entamoeba invadens IP1]|eukprot:XP_004259530.1 ornithine decarboxylase, putative [Entamoeba invadens IP1]